MTSLGDAYRSLPRTPAVSAVRDRHLDFYRSFARRAHEARFGRERDIWADLLEAELGNVRAALSWAIESGQGDAAQDLAASCFRLWESGRYTEGRIWLARSLAAGESRTRERTRALLAAADLARFPGGEEFLEEAWELAEQLEEPDLRVQALRDIAARHFSANRLDQAVATFEQAVEIGRDIPGAAPFVAAARYGLASFRAREELGDDRDPDRFLAALRGRLEEARKILEVPGLEGALCVNLGRHARLLQDQGDLTTPLKLLERKLMLEEDPGLSASRPDTLLSLGSLQLALGRREAARGLWQEVVDTEPVDGDNVLRAEVNLAELDMGEADLESALVRVERALAIARSARDPLDQYPHSWEAALRLRADLADHAGDPVAVERFSNEMLAASTGSLAVVRLALAAKRAGDLSRAAQLLRDELDRLESPDTFPAAALRALIPELEGDLDTAWNRSLEMRNVDDRVSLPVTWRDAESLASLALKRGDVVAARRVVEDAMPAAEAHPAGVPVGLLVMLARIAVIEGDSVTAWANIERVIPRWPQFRGAANWVGLLEVVACAAVGTSRVERGAELIGLADAERERLALRRSGYVPLDAAAEEARAVLGDEAFEMARARGRRMDLRTEMWAEARAVSEEGDDD